MSAFLFRSISNDTRAAVEIAYSALIHAGDLARYSGQACKARAKRSSTVRALVTRAIASCVCTPPHLCALSLSLSLSCPPPNCRCQGGMRAFILALRGAITQRRCSCVQEEALHTTRLRSLLPMQRTFSPQVRVCACVWLCVCVCVCTAMTHLPLLVQTMAAGYFYLRNADAREPFSSSLDNLHKLFSLLEVGCHLGRKERVYVCVFMCVCV